MRAADTRPAQLAVRRPPGVSDMNQHGKPVRLHCALALLWRARRASSPDPIHRSQDPVVNTLAALHRSESERPHRTGGTSSRSRMDWSFDIRVRQVFVQRNQRLVEPSQRDQCLPRLAKSQTAAVFAALAASNCSRTWAAIVRASSGLAHSNPSRCARRSRVAAFAPCQSSSW